MSLNINKVAGALSSYKKYSDNNKTAAEPKRGYLNVDAMGGITTGVSFVTAKPATKTLTVVDTIRQCVADKGKLGSAKLEDLQNIKEGVETLKEDVEKKLVDVSGSGAIFRFLRAVFGIETEYDKVLNTIAKITSVVDRQIEIKELETAIKRDKEEYAKVQPEQKSLSEKQTGICLRYNVSWSGITKAELTPQEKQKLDGFVEMERKLKGKEAKLYRLQNPPAEPKNGDYTYKVRALFGFGIGQGDTLDSICKKGKGNLGKLKIDKNTVLGGNLNQNIGYLASLKVSTPGFSGVDKKVQETLERSERVANILKSTDDPGRVVTEELNTMRKGDWLFVETGSAGHATMMAFMKNDQGEIITHYFNTGEGLHENIVGWPSTGVTFAPVPVKGINSLSPVVTKLMEIKNNPDSTMKDVNKYLEEQKMLTGKQASTGIKKLQVDGTCSFSALLLGIDVVIAQTVVPANKDAAITQYANNMHLAVSQDFADTLSYEAAAGANRKDPSVLALGNALLVHHNNKHLQHIPEKDRPKVVLGYDVEDVVKDKEERDAQLAAVKARHAARQQNR